VVFQKLSIAGASCKRIDPAGARKLQCIETKRMPEFDNVPIQHGPRLRFDTLTVLPDPVTAKPIKNDKSVCGWDISELLRHHALDERGAHSAEIETLFNFKHYPRVVSQFQAPIPASITALVNLSNTECFHVAQQCSKSLQFKI
jgi:hypothetical protein